MQVEKSNQSSICSPSGKIRTLNSIRILVERVLGKEEFGCPIILNYQDSKINFQVSSICNFRKLESNDEFDEFDNCRE